MIHKQLLFVPLVNLRYIPFMDVVIDVRPLISACPPKSADAVLPVSVVVPLAALVPTVP